MSSRARLLKCCLHRVHYWIKHWLQTTKRAALTKEERTAVMESEFRGLTWWWMRRISKYPRITSISSQYIRRCVEKVGFSLFIYSALHHSTIIVPQNNIYLFSPCHYLTQIKPEKTTFDTTAVNPSLPAINEAILYEAHSFCITFVFWALLWLSFFDVKHTIYYH